MGLAAAHESVISAPLEKERILLVIPLYNHGATISSVVEKSLLCRLPVLVVDDGSTDGGLQRINEKCHTIRFSENRGKGAALLAAAQWAEKKGFMAMVTIDADGQHDPADVSFLVDEALERKWPAVILGSRRMTQETVPGSSHFGKVFSNFWVRLESGLELDDTQSGFRLYPVRELCALSFSCSRYDFEIESLVKLAWGGVDVRAVSVSVYYPPAGERISHFDKWRDNLRLSWLHTRLVCRRLLPWPHKRLVAVPAAEKEIIEVRHPLRTLKNLCRESASPFWLAVAVWFGLFLGALPLLACHTVVIIYVTYRFRLNKVAAVAASQFCMPPVVPGICIETGYFLMHGTFLLDLSYKRWLLEVHYRLWEWLLGSLVVGPVLGFVGAMIVYGVARVVHLRMAR